MARPAAVFTALLAVTLTVPVSAQEWSSITPGTTTKEQVEKSIGTAVETSTGANGTSVGVYYATLGAKVLSVAYDAGGRVTTVTVEPASPLREADVLASYGPVKRTLGSGGSGNRIIDYPVGGAQAEYGPDGLLLKLTVRGGVATQGLTVDGVMRSLMGRKRP